MMKCIFVACGLAAGGAAAQQPAPPAPAPAASSSTQAAERPALKLKLEEPPARSEPRITFGPREGKGEQRPADLLPELGGRPSEALVRRPSEVVPKDENPGR